MPNKAHRRRRKRVERGRKEADRARREEVARQREANTLLAELEERSRITEPATLPVPRDHLDSLSEPRE